MIIREDGTAPRSNASPGTAQTGATVPDGGDTVYFALKTQNALGAWSALSNNAFWPRWDVWLPLTLR